jgi:hypothetical protein
MRLRSILFFVSLVICSVHQEPAFSQEMLGATLGNYSGVNGIQLNPSSMLGSKAYLDINLLSADAFLQNNYLYMARKEYNLTGLFKAGYELPSHPEEYGTESRNFYTFSNRGTVSDYVQVRVNGPGAMFVYGDHAFAITTSARSIQSAKNVPHEIANFAYLGLNYVPQHNINYKDDKPFRIGSMAWTEIGLSYAYTVYSRNHDQLSAGITVRRLFGYAGIYLKSSSADYNVHDDSTIAVRNFSGEMGYSLPLNYDDNSIWNDKLVKGGGFSGDIGFTYTRLASVHTEDFFSRPCAQRYNDYLYRIGVAIIDVGAIRFKSHAEKYAIDNRASYWDDVNDFKFRNIHQFMDTVSYKFYGSNTAAYEGSSFYMWLPSALSVQFDYHCSKNLYVNASLLYGFDLGPAAVSRPAQLSVTPRYETRTFEVSVPLSLYNWEKPRIGLAMRYYFVTVGTEKIGQFFNVSNFTGMDLYFAVHFTFDKGKSWSKKEGCREIDYRIKSMYR